jgi:cell division protein FtsI/penicillin-binding protein 2
MVTPIQMVQALGAIANGGYLVKPYIVEEIRSPNYNFKAETKVIRKVIDQRASTLLSGMMASVIKYGYGKLAQVPGYTVAGKTGTAQIADNEYGGYSNRTNHSFVGFAPVDNPAFVMIVKLENPRKGSFAESTAAPIFGRVAKFALKYLKVPPDEK